MKKFIIFLTLAINLFNQNYCMESSNGDNKDNILMDNDSQNEHLEKVILSVFNLFQRDNDLISVFNQLIKFFISLEFTQMSKVKRLELIKSIKEKLIDSYGDKNKSQTELTDELKKLINGITTCEVDLDNAYIEKLLCKILILIISGADPDVKCKIVGHFFEDRPSQASAPILKTLLCIPDIDLFPNLTAIIACLILFGADVNHLDSSNQTPIMIASFYLKNLRVIRLLVNFGATVDTQLLTTLLKYPILNIDKETLVTIMENSDVILGRKYTDETKEIVTSSLTPELLKVILKLMTKMKWDINDFGFGPNMETLLTIIVRYDNIFKDKQFELVELLLTSGVKDKPNKNNMTARMLAENKERVDLISLFDKYVDENQSIDQDQHADQDTKKSEAAKKSRLSRKARIKKIKARAKNNKTKN